MGTCLLYRRPMAQSMRFIALEIEELQNCSGVGGLPKIAEFAEIKVSSWSIGQRLPNCARRVQARHVSARRFPETLISERLRLPQLLGHFL
jgi:hypothetical protein